MKCIPENRWLIVSYFSGVDGMACAQHIDDRFSYLQQRGVSPLLLSSICGQPLSGIVSRRVPSSSPSGIRFELRHLRRRGGWVKLMSQVLISFLLPFYLLEKIIIDLDSQWSWFPLAILSGSRLCHCYRPEVIYSTGGPASAHLAAAVIARYYGLPWIAEIQDPLVHEDWHRSFRARKLYGWLERLICNRADAVVFMTDGARDGANRRTGLGQRGWTVYSGADPAAIPQTVYKRGEFCRFAHFGSLGGSRNLKVFLEALEDLLRERPEWAIAMRLDLYGTCDRLSLQLIEGFPMADIVTNHGRVPRQNSLMAMKQCDVLLLIQNTEQFSAESIPSKSYEYFHTGRPILGLIHKNPELSQMLTGQGHVAVAADDVASVREGIRECYLRWAEERTAVLPASPYTVQSAVDALIGIASGIRPQCPKGAAHG